MLGIAETQIGQCFQRAGVFIDTGENEVAMLAGQLLLAFEQAGIVPLHGFKLRRQRFGECFRALEAHEASDMRNAVPVFRHCVGLLVLDHLQAMFECAQEAIGRFQIGVGLDRDETVRRQRIQRVLRAPLAKVRHAATQDELLGLRKEFNLPDSAATQLDVVAGHRDRAMPLMRMDLALDRVDVLDRCVVKMAAPDERHDGFQERRACFRIAGTGTRLDERRPLPVLAHAFVIGLRSIGRDRDLRGAGIGPQAQVDPEDIAVGRRIGQQLYDAAHQIDCRAADIIALLERKSSRVVEDDKIDIARIVEFISAVLAHRENGQSGRRLQRRAIALRQLCLGTRLAQHEPERAVNTSVGKLCQRPRHLLERPASGNIGQRNGERRAALGRAKAAHRHSFGLAVGRR